MYAEIAAALQSAKTLAELLKAAKSLSNYNELASAVADVTSRLVDAQSVALASQEKLAALLEAKAFLEAKLREAETWHNELARYELVSIHEGAMAYALRSGMERGEPPHYLCAACVAKGQKAILQPVNSYLHCPNKHDAIRFRATPEVRVRTRPDYF